MFWYENMKITIIDYENDERYENKELSKYSICNLIFEAFLQTVSNHINTLQLYKEGHIMVSLQKTSTTYQARITVLSVLETIKNILAKADRHQSKQRVIRDSKSCRENMVTL